MIKKILFVIFFTLTACNYSKPKFYTKVSDLPAHMAHFDLDGFWTYRTANHFLDGGSVALGFFDNNGDVLYIWFDFGMNSTSKYRRCWLRKTYIDSEDVEILPGSEIETKVVSLMQKSISFGVLEEILPSRDLAIKILKTRNLHLEFKLTD